MKRVKLVLIIFGIFIFFTNLCPAAPNPSGNYVIADFDDKPDSNDPWAALTLVILDGNGNGSFQELYTRGGDLESSPLTYFVAEKGIFTINVEDEQAHGIVSADGSILTIAWAINGESPGIIVGIKKIYRHVKRQGKWSIYPERV